MRPQKRPRAARSGLESRFVLGGSRLRQDGSRLLACLATLLSLNACSTLPQSPPTTSSLELRAEAIATELSQIRGLGLKQPVPVGLKDKRGLRDAYHTAIEREWSDHDDGTERAYKLFGLLPEEMMLKSYLLDLYSAQVAGYYDPREGEFFVVEAEEGDSAEQQPELVRSFVLAHELVHALQDQFFDLEAIIDSFKRENDRGLATVAVMEGDAMLTASDHLLWQRAGWPTSLASPVGRRAVGLLSGLADGFGVAGDTPEARQLRDAPSVVRSELLFAYLQGMRFISAIRAEFGWTGVDAVLRDLPDSTEQILHPERYVDRRDRPATLHLADPPPGWTPAFSETLGMLTTRVLLQEYLGRWAARAAEGWEGDRYVVWDTPNGVALGWLTLWDTGFQAWRFERTYRRLLRRKLPEGQAFAVVRRGPAVAAVEGGSAAEVKAAAVRLLQSRVERSPDDAPAESMLRRWLRWPLSLRRLDRVSELALLGGHLMRLRMHSGGHQLSLLRGWLGRSERTPDRRQLSAALGLLWASSDRNHAYSAGGIWPLLDLHTRDFGSERQADFALLRLPLLGALFSLQRGAGMTRAELLRGLVLRVQWGPQLRRGHRVRLLMLPIPGL